MKKIFLFIFIVCAAFSSKAQYPNAPQTIGNDSNVVIGKGGLKGRLINWTFTDTSAANLQRIKDYPFAQIATTSDSSMWFRYNNMWIKLGGAQGGASGNFWSKTGDLFPVIPSGFGIGTNDATNLPFKTNGSTRLIIPSTGIVRSAGAANKYLTYDTITNTLYYGDGATGAGITQLTGDVTAGPGSGSQAATLANTAVTPGSYTNTNLTVDSKGRITAASNGSGGNTNSNIGSGYRWAVPNTNNVKTLFAGTNVTMDSTTNANGITIGVVAPGNYGNLILNRNLINSVAANDSLDFDAGLSIKGDLKVTNIPSGETTDSAVTYNTSTSQLRKKPLTVIDISSRDSGDVIQWNGTTNVYVPLPASSTADSIRYLEFIVDTTADGPIEGDTYVVLSAFENKKVLVWRNGLYQLNKSTFGITHVADTIYVDPSFETGETMFVEVRDITNSRTLSFPATGIQTIYYNSITNIQESSNVWTPSNSGSAYGQLGLDNVHTLPSSTDGRMYMTWSSATDGNAAFGFNTANAQTGYAGMETGVLITPSTGAINYVDGGSINLVGSSLANGNLVSVRRTGTTMYIEKSTDGGASWGSVLYTFSTTSSATLYPVCDLYNGSPAGVVRLPKLVY